MNIYDTCIGIVLMAVWIFLVIAGIMAIFIPFCLYRVRNEIIGTNRRLYELIKLTGDNLKQMRPAIDNFDKSTKVCPSCDMANMLEDTTCTRCRTFI